MRHASAAVAGAAPALLGQDETSAALAMRLESGMPLLAVADHATLAAANLALGDKGRAASCADQALAILDGCMGEGPECPQRDYFVCYEVLSAVGRNEVAMRALRSAHEQVMKRAARIMDAAARQSFLEMVPLNRRIVQESSRPTLPRKP